VLRVVLDTNVLISALAFQGETRKIWDLAESKQFCLFSSPFILSEVERNLLRLGLAADHTAILMEELRRVASVVEPSVKVSVIKQDETDNRILECALEARADVLVTGNLKHIRPVGSFAGIEILTPREFLTKYMSSPDC
jgi:putative PIN family toxin of toxin-antitoxin system